jgi:hypothetical protein
MDCMMLMVVVCEYANKMADWIEMRLSLRIKSQYLSAREREERLVIVGRIYSLFLT